MASMENSSAFDEIIKPLVPFFPAEVNSPLPERFRTLQFEVMSLIAETMVKVPSTMLGWSPERLKRIIDLCK